MLGGVCILNRVLWESLSEKVMCEQRTYYPRKPTLSWRVVHIELLGECFWDPHPQGSEGSQTGQGEVKLYARATKAAANPMGGSRARIALQSFLELGCGAQVFMLPCPQLLVTGCPGKRD